MEWVALGFWVLVVGPLLGIFCGWWLRRHQAEVDEFHEEWESTKRNLADEFAKTPVYRALERFSRWVERNTP